MVNREKTHHQVNVCKQCITGSEQLSNKTATDLINYTATLLDSEVRALTQQPKVYYHYCSLWLPPPNNFFLGSRVESEK